MSEHPTWLVGNRNPSITDVIRDENGVAINLTGLTVRFRARDLRASSLLVDQPISNTPDATGVVRYDWSAGDVTAPDGILSASRAPLVWWQVTSGGKTQDMNEALITILAHAPGLNAYVELEELKSSIELTGQTFADQDIQRELISASRDVDGICRRRFYPDVDAAQVRYYSPTRARTLEIDDLLTLTSVASDYDGDGTFEQTWVENTDFTLEPLNAVANGYPWETLRLHPRSSFCFSPYPRSLKVTGKFGWASVPSVVKTATTIRAVQLMLRSRQAPFGVLGVGGDGQAIRISRWDPDIQLLLGEVTRTQVLA